MDRKRVITDCCSSVSRRGDSSTVAETCAAPVLLSSDSGFFCRRINPLASRLWMVPDWKPWESRTRCQAPPPLRSSSSSIWRCLGAFGIAEGPEDSQRSTHQSRRTEDTALGRWPSHPGGNAALSMRKELVWQRVAMASSHDRQDGSTAARCTSSSTGLSSTALLTEAFTSDWIGLHAVTSPCNRRPRRRTATRSPSPTPRLRLSQ